MYIIGIDTGTSNTKAVAFSTDGQLIGESVVAYSTLTPAAEGYSEHDPGILFKAALQVLRSVISRLPSDELAGISFSSAMHSLMAVNKQGDPIMNLITWADLRSSVYSKHLHQENKANRLSFRTGTPVHPMSPLCKLMWLRDEDPNVYGNAFKFISIKEYILYKLTGDYIIDHSLASATGLFDIYTLQWNKEALELAGIDANKLSIPARTGTQLPEIKEHYLDELGLKKSVPLIIGASDGCLANLGSNALRPGDVSVTIGTSGAVRMTVSKPFDSYGKLFNYILTENLFIAGGPVNNAGNLLKWYAENFLHRPFTESADFGWFVETAMKAPAGCDGLIFLPYIQGERAPVWNADAKGVFFGIRTIHNQFHFMRAIVEGICYALFQVLHQLETSIGPAKNIMASGGFIRSTAWLKVLASVFNKPVKVLNAADASAVGAAIIGLHSLGFLNDLSDASEFFPDSMSIYPETSEHEIYMKNFQVYDKLYINLKELL